MLKIKSAYQPAGDQPQAIAKLIDGLKAGLTHQTLLGVTGSGKTFTIAHTIEAMQRTGTTALAVDAGRTLLLDKGDMLRLANQAGITVIGNPLVDDQP